MTLVAVDAGRCQVSVHRHMAAVLGLMERRSELCEPFEFAGLGNGTDIHPPAAPVFHSSAAGTPGPSSPILSNLQS
ncbi:hypothetical protein GCM10025331_83110 [Actinoplanes utahensis]|nr:hypothetical protein Aut01nite_51720 [Actinoplanes utahensis]